jgi:hypothetical protein
MVNAEDAVRNCVAKFNGTPNEKDKLEVYLSPRLGNTNLPLTDERIAYFNWLGVAYVRSLSRARTAFG